MDIITTFEKPFEHFSKTALSYYNLWSYFDQRLKHRLASRATHSIKSCFEFYDGMYNGHIKHGDRIILHDFFLTEWVSRSPGELVNLVNSNGITKEDYRRFSEYYHPARFRLKSGDAIPPLGSIRFPLVRENNVLVGAVSAEEYHADQGIVISLNPNVYSEFLSKQFKNNAVAATIEGYVDCLESEKDNYISKKNPNKNSFFTPKNVIRVTSPLQAKFFTHDSHPRFNAWLMRRKEYGKPPIQGMTATFFRKGDSIRSSKPKMIYGDMIQYDFCNWTVLDNDQGEIRTVRKLMSREFISVNANPKTSEDKESLYAWLMPKEEEEDKTKYGIVSVQHLTEFDGRVKTGQVLIKLDEDPRRGDLSPMKYIAEIRKIEKSLKRNRS